MGQARSLAQIATLYCIPRTAILGAVLLTGYLGGAVEANVQVSAPLVSNTLFPIYFAVFVWGSLVLRDHRVLRIQQRAHTSTATQL